MATMQMTEERWHDRCERYFSSMSDPHPRSNPHPHPASHPHPQTAHRHRGPPPHPSRQHPHVNTYVTRGRRRPWRSVARWLGALDLHGTSLLPRVQSWGALLAWLLVSAVSLGAVAYLGYLAASLYLSQTPHLRLDPPSPGLPPALSLAVSLCNNNPLRRSSLVGTRLEWLTTSAGQGGGGGGLQSVGGDDLETLLAGTPLARHLAPLDDVTRAAALSGLEGEYAAFAAMLSESDWAALYFRFLEGDLDVFRRALRMSRAELRQHGHRLQVLTCRLNGLQCPDSMESTEESEQLGLCVTFNVSTATVGVFGELELAVDVGSLEHVGLLAQSAGIQLVIRDARTPLTFTSRLHAASPGSSLQIHLDKVTDLQRGQPCQASRALDAQDCLESCLNEKARALCGCQTSWESSSSQRCRVHIQYDYICSRALRRLLAIGSLQCDCPPLCQEQTFSVHSSLTPWPSPDFQPHVLSAFEEQGFNYSAATLSSSVVHVRLSAPAPLHDSLKEEADVTWLQLLAMAGGLWALAAGVSLVTGLQMLWLLVKLLLYACRSLTCSGRQGDMVQKLDSLDELTSSWSAPRATENKWTRLEKRNNLEAAAWEGRGAKPGVETNSWEGRGARQGLETNSWESKGAKQGVEATHWGVQGTQLREGEQQGSRDQTSASPRSDPVLVPPLPLTPILEEGEELPSAAKAREEELYAHAWERTGQARPQTRLLVPLKDSNLEENPPPLHAPPTPVLNGGPRMLLPRQPPAQRQPGRQLTPPPFPLPPARVLTPADFIEVYAPKAYGDASRPRTTNLFYL